MNPSLRFQLEVEAWRLVCKLSLRLENEVFHTASCRLVLNVFDSRSAYVSKLTRVHAHAYDRFLRRQAFLYD
jgi:hypothetical protein